MKFDSYPVSESRPCHKTDRITAMPMASSRQGECKLYRTAYLVLHYKLEDACSIFRDKWPESSVQEACRVIKLLSHYCDASVGLFILIESF